MDKTPRKGSIVVGVDGSPLGKMSLEWAAAQAGRRHLPIHLVHAFAPDEPSAIFGGGADQSSLVASSERILEDAKARIHTIAPDVPVTGVSASGFASAALIRASHGAELVVVGARGQSTLMPSALGSVALQVAEHAHSPVTVVRHAEADHLSHRRVVVGVDGSPDSLRAVDYAYLQADQRGAELLVLHAWWPERRQDVADVATSDWPSYEADKQAAVAKSLESAAATYPDVKVRQEVVRGNPLKLLVERSSDADLVIVGARGTGGFTGLLLGSVSNDVLRRAACPVAIVRKRLVNR